MELGIAVNQWLACTCGAFIQWSPGHCEVTRTHNILILHLALWQHEAWTPPFWLQGYSMYPAGLTRVLFRELLAMMWKCLILVPWAQLRLPTYLPILDKHHADCLTIADQLSILVSLLMPSENISAWCKRPLQSFATSHRALFRCVGRASEHQR